MRLHILSDLHLEFDDRHPPWVPPKTGADVVVLAGDIDNGTRAIDWAEQVFPGQRVLYVPGNHEFYEGETGAVLEQLRDRARRSPNVQVLDNTRAVIGGVRFLGTTLWTDFELFGAAEREASMAESRRYVTDFRLIEHGPGRRLTPQDTIELHRAAVAFLSEQLAVPFDGATVVITHHGPHPNSVHPRWAQTLSSGAFVSDLSQLFGIPRLWIHGHTHDGFDYAVRGTQVIANPMGYRTSNWRTARTTGETPWVRFENAAFDPARVAEV